MALADAAGEANLSGGERDTHNERIHRCATKTQNKMGVTFGFCCNAKKCTTEIERQDKTKTRPRQDHDQDKTRQDQIRPDQTISRQ